MEIMKYGGAFPDLSGRELMGEIHLRDMTGAQTQ